MLKTCSKCKEEKDTSEFAKTGRREGLFSSLCKPCSSKKASEWNKKNPLKRRKNSKRHKMKSQYGITLEQLDRMKISQNNQCALCFKVKRLVVDHNHATGKVRELLCNNCNVGVGAFMESTELMKRAIEYVIKHT